jgi:hypothetical protein
MFRAEIREDNVKLNIINSSGKLTGEYIEITSS